MIFPANPFSCATDPDSQECKDTKKFFRELLEYQYLIRFFPRISPPHPLPDPLPNLGDPSPQPSIQEIFQNQNVLIGELILHSLHVNANNTLPSMIKEIKDSGIALEVVKKLIHDFEKATKLLSKEKDFLENSLTC